MMWLLIALDQISKAFVYSNKPMFGIIDNIFEIHYLQNSGAIFGLFAGSNGIMIWLSVILCIIVLLYIKTGKNSNKFEDFWLEVILAGGVSNLIDRILRGFVVDFIAVKYIGIFNLADCFIVIGAIVILFREVKELLKDGKASSESK